MSSQAILSDQDLLKNREIGKSVNSKLGKKLVTGQGQFIDDLHLPLHTKLHDYNHFALL